MSDLEISGSDSEPVSEVSPEEMARLVADLGDMDNDLFNNTRKSKGGGDHGGDAKKQDAKDLKGRVTSTGKPISPVKAESRASEDDDDDWDADDILNSDDDAKPKGKPVKKLVHSDGPPHSSEKVADSETKGKDFNEESSKKVMAKSKLMADLFSDTSQDSMKKGLDTSKSPISTNVRKDKSKLMADLFGDESSNPDKLTKSTEREQKDSGGKTARRGAVRKGKDDITFDDDDGELLGGLGESKKKSSAVFESSKSGSFLDSLLSKSKSSDYPKIEKEKRAVFVLDDKYKNMSKGDKEENNGAFGEYTPSASKPNSPHRRTPQKVASNDNFDIFDSEPRKRNPRSATQKKAFRVDDDDILGNIRSRRSGSKEVKDIKETDTSLYKMKSDSVTNAASSPTKVQNKDEWLFGSPGNVSGSIKKNMDEASVMASIEQGYSGNKKSSPSKSQDWLGNILSSKKSPTVSKQFMSEDSSSVLKQPNSASRTVSVPASSDPNLGDSVGVYASSPQNNHNVQSLPVPAPNVTSNAPTVKPVSSSTPIVPTMTSPMTSKGVLISEELQNQFLIQQQAQAQATSVAAQLKSQQDQIEMLVAQKLQEQQHQMVDLMKRQQEAVLKRNEEASFTVSQHNLNPSVTENYNQKGLEVDLRTAEVEVARLKAELDLLRKQHAEEVAMLEEGYRRKMDMEKEIRDQVEKRLREERDSILSDFHAKMSLVQEEKESLASSYEVQLAGVKSEWSHAVERTKELYSGMVERMKEEHQATLERMINLKELEVKAALSASGHVREVEAVMTQLESNTSNLSELTSSINIRHDSALELTQRALKMKEKQLVDFEAQLAASRAEAESERARLNTLIQRLENTLVQQGSEVEKERWRLAQEQLKIEVERQGLVEERRHLQMNAEMERQNLTTARESFMSEHRSLLQSVAQQKQELANQQAHFSVQQKLAHATTVGPSSSVNVKDVDAEIALLREEHRQLREKMAAISCQEQNLKEEEIRLEQLSLQLEQEKAKVQLERDIIAKDKISLAKTREEIEAAKQEVNDQRDEQQARLKQITSETRTYHTQQEKLENEHLKLQQLRGEVVHLVQSAICPLCRTKGAEFILDYVTKPYNGRFPGDGQEGHNTSLKMDSPNRVNVTPSSVLARLAAARQHENMEREKRLLQMSALEPS
ncbi:uncharacterized protein [Panulirus ornatus]|uniref:uncharacterized protein n=1 Tax=Panulirus ornatus TaxID=150431 RepID=UPI003A8484EF